MTPDFACVPWSALLQLVMVCRFWANTQAVLVLAACYAHNLVLTWLDAAGHVDEATAGVCADLQLQQSRQWNPYKTAASKLASCF
jgi:hypothetical protein